jgi:predicted nucleic acid-binding protein
VGLTVVDAGVVIALLDAREAHHASARRALSAARNPGDEILLSASASAESLVAPYRRSRRSAAKVDAFVDAFVDALPAHVEPITRPVASP